ncbi:polymer-forming cytoskeletal protein [bacterium]|jgi:cytoskeletal protein CcmA (bactofilin family)|nr:polymer-forming cytoskeletal protein [bacterium]
MLNNKKEKENQSNFAALNVIGEGTTIKGDLISNGDLRIDGEVIGSIKTKAKCVLGNSCKVTGNVEAKNCDISGKVEGDVRVSDILLIKSTGIINGDLKTSKLVVESGGEFNGSCTMGSAVSMNQKQGDEEKSHARATA